MTGGWIAMAVLAAVAMLVVARPWLRARLPQVLRRRAANVAAYRSRLAEIEAERAAGLLSADAAEAMKQEQGRRLLADADTAPEEGEPTTTGWRGVGLLLALLPVLIAAAWYLQDGSWRTAETIVSGIPPADDTTADLGRIRSMVDHLKEQLRTHPDNPQGWALLGRSQMVLHRYAESATAYGEANRRSGDSNPDWLVAQGQSLAMAGGRNLQGEPARLFEEALQVAPDDPRALWFAGIAAAQAGDDARARTLWQRLASQKMPQDVHDAIEAQIRQLGPGTATASSAPGGTTGSTPVELHVEVRLASSLRDKLPPKATLYVYARAAKGPPVPLAVRRITDPHLPLEITLDDSQAVMSGARLEAYGRWTLVARLSAGGDARPAPGDLQGETSLSREEAGHPVRLVIDHVLP